MGQFQYAAAHETFRSVLDQSPDLIEVRVNLAIATLNRQDPRGEQETLAILQEVLEESPDHQRALYTSGIVHLYLGNPRATIEFLTTVSNLDPNDAYCAYFLGQAHLQLEEYQQAKDWFLRAIELDEYLQSAYWAASTAARRLNDVNLANDLVETYSRYDANPLSKTAGISYKEMGSKAEALVLTETRETVARPFPTGDLFASPLVLYQEPIETNSVSISDFDHDLDWDIHFVQERCILTLENVDGDFRITDSHGSWRCIDALGVESNTSVSLYWGDLDNDLNIDLVVCSSSGVYTVDLEGDRDSTSVSIFEDSCSNGVLYDADHDGDLDFLAVSRGRLHLINNNLDGTFTDITDKANLTETRQVHAVNVGDFDSDRDLDIALLDIRGRLWVFFNNRTWSYSRFPTSIQLDSSDAIVVADWDSDGLPNLLIDSEGAIQSFQFDRTSQTFEPDATFELALTNINSLTSVDFDGDGSLDLLARSNREIQIYSPSLQAELATIEQANLTTTSTLYQSSIHGPALVTLSNAGMELYPPGPGRANFLSLHLTGKTDSDQMRSNASAVGSQIKVRASDSWIVLNTIGNSSESGQNLQPISSGLGHSDHASFIEVLWTDGVTQSEIELESGKLHSISETQRQLASCPVVFVWNGEKHEFVSDVLGVAALGYFHQIGENAPYRSFERILLKPDSIQPQNGYFEVKIGEPMEEVLYLDAAYLDTYDIPSTHGLVIDERLNVNSESPTGRPIAYRDQQLPSKAVLGNSVDVTDELLRVDHIAPSLQRKDPHFIGLLADPVELRVRFDEPLQSDHAILVATGWVEFPYSQTVFAASQSGRSYDPPTLDIKLTDGTWHTLVDRFGYPAGMPKQMTLPLPEIPDGVREIRLTTNMEIYWDQIRIVYEDPEIKPRHYRNEASHGYVLRTGFAKRFTGPQKVPYYDYNDRSPYWDAKYATGLYTRTGNITELINQTDSALAIVGSGEEIHLKFPDYLPPPPPKHQRYYVLDFRGWAKDMDLYTEYGDTVEPIPSVGTLSREERSNRAKLHREYNTRFRTGFVTH